MSCKIWYHFCNLRNSENTQRGVLILAFTKSNTPPWVFFTFLNCTDVIKSRNASHIFLNRTKSFKKDEFQDIKFWLSVYDNINLRYAHCTKNEVFHYGILHFLCSSYYMIVTSTNSRCLDKSLITCWRGNVVSRTRTSPVITEENWFSASSMI